jgi:Bacteriophage minor capsid protein
VSTTFVGVSESICSYLASIPALGLTAGTNLFAGLQPDKPDALVCVFERPGMSPVMTMTGAPAPSGGTAQPTSLLDRPLIQVRVRGAMGGYAATNTQMEQVFGALQGVANTAVPGGGMFFLLIEATGSPLFMGQDTQQRPEFSLNLQLMLQNTQRVPE